MLSIGLPLELIQLIFEVESLKVNTLRSCALACRAWLPFARQCLFHKVSLRASRDCTGLAGMLKSSPDIAECVRVLSIDMAMSHYRQPLVVTGVVDVCSQLAHVQSLKLWNLPLRSLGTFRDDFFSLVSLHTSNSVHSLELVGVTFQYEDQFLQFVSTFHRMNNLSLTFVGMDFSADERKPNEPIHRRPRLRSLVTRSCHRRIYALLYHATILELEHLSLMMTTKMAGMPGIVDACFQDIEELGSIDSMESLTLQYGSASTVYGKCEFTVYRSPKSDPNF